MRREQTREGRSSISLQQPTIVTASERLHHKLTFRKRVLFSLICLGLLICIAEVLSYVIWQLFPPIKLTDLAQFQHDLAHSGRDHRNNRETLHPYMGWVFDPDIVGKSSPQIGDLTVNELGFVDSGPSIRKRHSNQFLIGVFGGSVAQQMTAYSESTLIEQLKPCSELTGRDIQIVRLAMAGYKQPQQLMQLNYVLALGAEFDMVVNIDGYNETGMAIGDSRPRKLFIAYPSGWDARLTDVVDPRVTSDSYRLLRYRAIRQGWANWIIHSPLRRSWTVSLLWAAQDRALLNQQVDLGAELRKHRVAEGLGFARQGPHKDYGDISEMADDAAMLWRNSSLQMHHLCQGRGIRYLHFLQPNLYHSGSKPLSEDEKLNFYSPDQDVSQAVTLAYPLLIAQGRQLQKSGVAFRDLTQLFANVTDTMYSDYFCHYNQSGNDRLAIAVAETIAEDLTAHPNSPTTPTE